MKILEAAIEKRVRAERDAEWLAAIDEVLAIARNSLDEAKARNPFGAWSEESMKVENFEEFVTDLKARMTKVSNMQTTSFPVDHPGVYIGEELEARGWDQADLAYTLNAAPQSISLIISGKRDISPAMAKSLASAFDVSPELFINLQRNYDLYRAHEMVDRAMRRAVVFLVLGFLISMINILIYVLFVMET
ncbi:MAG TPA: HigA family addiction module antitoxin [Hyphomicrobiales bacterium]|nr:HigA family addiction module antitoxin [Hyphomicrobiales bacterium]